MAETWRFFDLLHVNRPSDIIVSQTYKMAPLPATTRHSFPGWTDPLQLPSPSWYDAAAAGLNPSHGWVAIDHEAWTGETQADRIATSAKFATVYRELKSRRPDLKFGFYAYGIRVDFTKPAYPIDDSRYIAWQRENEDYAEMNAVVDALFPTLYCWFDVASDGLPFMQFRFPKLFHAYILECRRMLATYGDPNRSVFPYIWWRKHDDTRDLDAWVWKEMLCSCVHLADGWVLWGGHQRQWDANNWWICSTMLYLLGQDQQQSINRVKLLV